MSVLAVRSNSSVSGPKIGNNVSILNDITNWDCNLAIWQRTVPSDPSDIIERTLEDVRVKVPAANPEVLLRRELDRSGFPDTLERDALIEDIVALCRIFHRLSHRSQIEIRLELVTTDSCWKFHSDYVEMRLITTYVGRGTQWLDQRDVDRMANGFDPIQIHELAPGDVGMFKGRLGTKQPAIHRSPPIEGSGEKRLLLVLNPAED